MTDETAIGGAARDFPATRWTLIQSSQAAPETKRAALEALLGDYWKPLYFYARRKGHSIEAAKDIVQGFFLHLLERDFLGNLDPERGRFRSYLRTALDHYLVNLHEHAAARKRGGAVRTVSLEFEVAERELSHAPAAAEAAFDQEWALAVLERALDRLRREFESGKRSGPIEVALTFFRPGEPPSYAQAAAECRMSPAQFKAFLHRARERYRELVRASVLDTVRAPAEADGEVDALLRALS